MAGLPFDQRDGHIWMNGEFVEWSDAKLHVLSHGLHYGSGVFEGERAYGGEIFKLTEHTERLFKSAEILDMEIPYTVEERPETGLYNAKFGVWLFLASEVMLFGALFSAYVLLRTGDPGFMTIPHHVAEALHLGEGMHRWPEELNVPLAFVNTLVLIFSSVTIVLS